MVLLPVNEKEGITATAAARCYPEERDNLREEASPSKLIVVVTCYRTAPSCRRGGGRVLRRRQMMGTSGCSMRGEEREFEEEDGKILKNESICFEEEDRKQHAIAIDVFLIHHCFAVASPNAGRHCRLLVCSAMTLPAPPLLCRTPTAAEGPRTLVSVAPSDANRSCSAELLPTAVRCLLERLRGEHKGFSVMNPVLTLLEVYTHEVFFMGFLVESSPAVELNPTPLFLKDKGGWAWKSDERYGKNVEVD
nr:hypothetical protein Iba_chr03dCG2680 [Ipomoea batatas]